MTTLTLSRRTRTFLLWTARVAFLAYFVQLIAIDHWHTHPSDILGVEGTSTHVEHCHGAGDCSDGGGAVSNPAQAAQASLPLPSPSLTLGVADNVVAPRAAYTETPGEPPREASRAA
ncbi:MAG TPA: hypothetical protein VG845_11265 [Dehalococcoidia bacterium]|jgi:hypothetical protein|nr:hypothetical protein [Dehalococcoidia bacterium]